MRRGLRCEQKEARIKDHPAGNGDTIVDFYN